MKSLILLFFILNFYSGRTQCIDTIKSWFVTDKLRFEDFRGRIPEDETESTMMAVCASEIIAIPYENGGISYIVYVVFLKNQSWIKNTSLYTLAHEQLHFDISELHARKLRKSIKEIRNKNRSDKERCKLVVEKFLLENNQMQDNYDYETAHGLLEGRQLEWNVKIAKELDTLKEYVSTLVDCE